MHKSFRRKKEFTSKTRPITPSLLLKIRQKFIQKGWAIEDDHENTCFQRYCSMISGLVNDEQENFIFDLTDRFLTIEDREYERYFFYSVKNLLRAVQCKNIYVIPMIAPEDIGYSVKSGGRVAYLLKGTKIKTFSEYKQQTIKLYENIERLPDDLSKDEIIILTDDFMGSGDTAIKAINHIFKIKPNLRYAKIIIICIAALRTGVELLESRGIDVYATVILNKGISDYYEPSDKIFYLSLMDQIENRIKAPYNYKLGYKQSEALISLIRPPNNTFPVFWLDNKIAKSPFPR
ncbi:phosphoribosyltransferase-like protein [Spirosoma endophyticum]|uniref:PRTase-CE domain-containing protein n=1 Tax=Spirosoma endophyticum TaxID=662367 RepID=A0A1I2E5L8_9BACT|nr:uracil phosphoribosyltransferase [Spirosoma endophyticum]SFE87781.1 hypothetical protein SAMN05216167_12121 [Spirosoma endophyticum]